MKIYLASSWRNPFYETILDTLIYLKYQVYDFKNPRPNNTGFHWQDINQDFENWTPKEYVEALGHELSTNGFALDFRAMQRASVCILLLPAGRSAHLEAGFFVGRNRPLFILLPPDGSKFEIELMYLMATKICVEQIELYQSLENLKNSVYE